MLCSGYCIAGQPEFAQTVFLLHEQQFCGNLQLHAGSQSQLHRLMPERFESVPQNMPCTSRLATTTTTSPKVTVLWLPNPTKIAT
jgi:hypothetical protein